LDETWLFNQYFGAGFTEFNHSMTSASPKIDAAPAKLISVILVRKGMKDKIS
jgi:hypothetical protein